MASQYGNAEAMSIVDLDILDAVHRPNKEPSHFRTDSFFFAAQNPADNALFPQNPGPTDRDSTPGFFMSHLLARSFPLGGFGVSVCVCASTTHEKIYCQHSLFARVHPNGIASTRPLLFHQANLPHGNDRERVTYPPCLIRFCSAFVQYSVC